MGQARTTGKISEVVDSDGENKIDNHFKDSMVILKELERITNTFSTDWSVYSDSNWYFFWRINDKKWIYLIVGVKNKIIFAAYIKPEIGQLWRFISILQVFQDLFQDLPGAYRSFFRIITVSHLKCFETRQTNGLIKIFTDFQWYFLEHPKKVAPA